MSEQDDEQQLDLFGGGAKAPPKAQGVADPYGDDLRAVGESLPAFLRLGTSSFTFEGWRDLVYFRDYGSKKAFTRDSLGEYVQHPLFDTVCLDRGFYAPIAREELAHYRALIGEAAPRFKTVLKAFSEVVTFRYPRHARLGERAGKVNPRFLDHALFADVVAAPYRDVMGDAAGPVLLEIPPSYAPPSAREFAAGLSLFLETHRASSVADVDVVVELREPSLLTPRYFDILREYDAGHAYNFWTRMPPVGEQLKLSGTPTRLSMARLMLPPGAHYEGQKAAFAPFDKLVKIQAQMRRDVLKLARAVAAGEGSLFVIVNNKAEGCSPLTVEAIARQVVKRDG